MSLVPSIERRTLSCLQCGQTMFEGLPCQSCGAVFDPEVLAAEADKRELFLRAFSHANSLAVTARIIPVLLVVSLLPFMGLLAYLGVPALMLFVPASALVWRKRYGEHLFLEPDYPQVRAWLREALLVWGAVLVLSPLWLWFVFKN